MELGHSNHIDNTKSLNNSSESLEQMDIFAIDIDDNKRQLHPKQEDHIRILHISDTHSLHKSAILPECDILIHSGDFCYGYGTYYETKSFVDWLEKQTQCKHKVIIAGNHEFSFDLNTKNTKRRDKILNKEKRHDPSIPMKQIKELVTKNPNFTY